MFLKSLGWRTLLVAAAVAVGVLGLSLGLCFFLRSDAKAPGPHSGSAIRCEATPSPSYMGVYWNAAVATNGYPCAIIGRDILMRNGSAVEAAIAALFCEGVTCLQSMGIGGGFLMTVYSRASRKAETLNARETAPAAAYEDMFHGNSTLSQFGGKAVAVPGELLGYWEAFQKYKSNNVEWYELIEPTIKLCEDGIVVTPYLEKHLKNNEEKIMNSPSIWEILKSPDTGKLLTAGERLRRPQLARTLRQIASSGGVDIFYKGPLGQQFVEDIRKFGGIMTTEDLYNYKVKWMDPVLAYLQDDITLYTVPLPGSGVILAFILNILNGNIPTFSEVTTYQRIIEAFKFGYGKRTHLGDPDFVDLSQIVKNLTSLEYANLIWQEIEDKRTWQDPAHYGSVVQQPEDHGTAHISVVAPNGDAVSVTSTINLVLGAMIRSQQTGIIMNNEMDDFSAPNITNAFGIPPSPNNFIKPGKRPLSSMCPAIFIDANGDVRLVIGAAGGTKITSATALTSMYNLWFNMTVKQAVDARRLHHQLFPMVLQYEEGFPTQYICGLQTIGHHTHQFALGGSSVTGIARHGPFIFAVPDFRRGGITAGF